MFKVLKEEKQTTKLEFHYLVKINFKKKGETVI